MTMMLDAFQEPEHLPFLFEAEGNRAALLTHGFPGSAKEMRPVAQLLHDMGWTTQGVLLPGFGPEIETIMEKKHTDWQQTVDTALAQLRHNHDTVLLIGNSMGGALSIQAAAKHGADGLMLFAPFWTIDHILWKALPVLKHVIPRFKPFSVFKPDFQDPEFQKGTRNFFPNADFDDPEFQRMTLNMEIQTSVFDQIRNAGLGGYEAAPDVKVSTLVIQGTGDDLVKPEVTQKLLDRLGGTVTYREVDAPHNPIDPAQASWEQVADHIRIFTQQFT